MQLMKKLMGRTTGTMASEAAAEDAPLEVHPDVLRIEAEMLRLRQEHDRRVTELLGVTTRLVDDRRALAACLRDLHDRVEDDETRLRITALLAATAPR